MENPDLGLVAQVAPILGTVVNVILLVVIFTFRRFLRSRCVFGFLFSASLFWFFESILHGLSVHGATAEILSDWLCSLAALFLLIGLSAHLFNCRDRTLTKVGI